MRNYRVSLREVYGIGGGELECILSGCPLDVGASEWKRPAVVVVPGGGYWAVSRREGEPVAQGFLARGFQTFVLTYRCRPDGARYPEQLIELAAAVDYVKKHAAEYSVDADEVFAVGFSAGGHLTANLAVDYAGVGEKSGLKLDCRPKAVGLGYPVITSQAGHTGSYDNLLEGYTAEAKGELMKCLDLDAQVSDTTPPAFLWTTSEDSCVPSENTLLFALALARRKIPYELHVYPRGEHGASTCDFEVNAPAEFLRKNGKWLDDCADFFRLFTARKF